MNPRVEKVKPLKDFKLPLFFKNGEEKIFDVTPYLGIGVFKKLQDITLFTTARAYLATVVWQNNIDFDPDTLYLEGENVKAVK